MNFNEWLDIESNNPELKDFIEKIKPFFTTTGFNGPEFEKRVMNGLHKIDFDINNSLKPNVHTENQ